MKAEHFFAIMGVIGGIVWLLAIYGAFKIFMHITN